MHSLLQDLRYGFRQLRKSPGFALTAIISLALGIGATTAVFSVVYAVLLDPYPYANSDRMVHMVVKLKSGPERWLGFTASQYQTLLQSHAIESAVAEDGWSLTTTGGDLPENVEATYFTGNGFNHFGVPVLLGRGLQPSDTPEGADPEPVAVLGYKFWQRHYNGDSSVVGKTIQLVHKNYTIIGVAQPRFTWGDADVYLPLKLSSDPARAYQVDTKLKPGVTHGAANAEFQALFEQFAKDSPKHFPHESFRVAVKGLNDRFLERLGPTLALLLGSVSLLLLIGCGNVSILMLARGTAREHEFAVRAAVGAARARLVRQLLTESLLLSLTGAALGVALAYESVAVIVAMLPEGSFPHEAVIHINLPVLCFSVALAVFTGVFFGLSPAVKLSRPEVSQVMQASAKKVMGGVRGKRVHNLLIAGQIALTLLLLASAGAAIQGFLKLNRTPLGYNPHHVMSVGIPVHDNSYTSWESRAQYFTQLRQKVATLPQVKMAGISTNATPPDNGADNIFELEGKPTLEDKHARLNFVSQEYFSVLQIPLLQGRLWDDAETQRGARVAVINETLAKQYFPAGDAVGRLIRTPNVKADPPITQAIPQSNDWFEIIGVVGDALDDGLGKPIKPGIYVPYTIFMPVWTQILVRSDVPPLSILDSVRRQIHTVDADQQTASHVRNLEEWITSQQEWSQQHLVAMLFGAFAALALSLAAVGLYSVVSYTVAQRTNEFGVRMALGAQRSDVLRIVVRSTAISVGGGIVAGVVLSLAMRRIVAQWVQGSSISLVVLLGVIIVLGTVAAMACALPARRASTIDPMQALRYE
ncbi:MAG TPA: ABC transporter permease [Candidatus Eisenbacteria bacterium]|nr:ABC transporter permease [Candidatus Eisenbacteria bacterium]